MLVHILCIKEYDAVVENDPAKLLQQDTKAGRELKICLAKLEYVLGSSNTKKPMYLPNQKNRREIEPGQDLVHAGYSEKNYDPENRDCAVSSEIKRICDGFPNKTQCDGIRFIPESIDAAPDEAGKQHWPAIDN